MKEEFVRNPYNYDSDQLSHSTGLECKDPSLTDQSALEESNINYIAEKFMRTGEVPQVINMPTSGDFEGIFDFQTAMNTIVVANQEFMRLPAKIRSRFDNDPAKLIAFIEDDSNREEAEALKLIPKKEKPNEGGTHASTQATPEKPAGTTGTPPTQAANAGTQKP